MHLNGQLTMRRESHWNRRLALVAMVFASCAYGATATGTAAEKIEIVDCSKVVHEVDSVPLAYNPGWTWVTNTPGAYVVIEKTLYPKTARVGVPQAVTTEVQRFAADTAGDFVFTPASDDERCVTLTHRVYSASGTEIGTALTAKVSVGVRSAASSGVFYDDATNAMQKVVDATGAAPLAHSVAWVPNAATWTIWDACTATGGGVSRRQVSAGSDEGVLDFATTRFRGGAHVLSISFEDAEGNAIPDATRTVAFCAPYTGFILIFK